MAYDNDEQLGVRANPTNRQATKSLQWLHRHLAKVSTTSISLRLGWYLERGITLYYLSVNGKRLDVVMTFATRWRILSA
jgi:hypothetical protein